METDTIESLWIRMKIAISGDLKIGLEIEHPRYYASKIAEIDKFYGYLAWSDVFISENELDRAENVLNDVMSNFQDRPETYIKLWHLYYYRKRTYAKA
jgi:hypothetical protein